MALVSLVVVVVVIFILIFLRAHISTIHVRFCTIVLSVFAYGQTSSGKTFTMQGNRASAKNNASRNGVDGITHMAARDIFATIAADPQHSYAVRVSFLEIYNEEVRDLLVAADGKSNAAGAGGQRQQATLAVREDPKAGVFVENLTSHRVYNLDTLLHYLNLGEKHKSVAATGMNDRSSRSHTIFRITVERKKKVVAQQGNGAGLTEANGSGKGGGNRDGIGGVKLVATLNLVDLVCSMIEGLLSNASIIHVLCFLALTHLTSPHSFFPLVALRPEVRVCDIPAPLVADKKRAERSIRGELFGQAQFLCQHWISQPTISHPLLPFFSSPSAVFSLCRVSSWASERRVVAGLARTRRPL